VLQVIARLNIGGTAHHVTVLAGRLDPILFETLLVTGELGPGEGSFEDLAAQHGARVEHVPSMGPELRPADDLRALVALVRIIRRYRPDIVHTHTAKAGTLGRLAARVATRRRPVVVHTYHGHVLTGYFGTAKNTVFRRIERALARISDCLIGVSAATVEELVDLGIAPRDRFRVIYNGQDLDELLAVRPGDGDALRTDMGVAEEDLLVLFVGRLVPIKRVDVLLDAVRHARGTGAPVRLWIVGDGDLRPELERQAGALGISDAVTFLGFRRDLPQLTAACDVAVLCSDNEAMGMALVEAAAAGRPAFGTDVGGVGEVVPPDGLVPAGDAAALGALLAAAADDRPGLERRGAAARAFVRETFTTQRLVADIEALYQELLARRSAG
jgi:glycosyltransferase involved in cell wall biosynthesis